MSDPIADMLTRIRNASSARHTEVLVPASRTKLAIARILKDEGFIADFDEVQAGPRHDLRIQLKYVDGKVPVVSAASSASASPACASTRARPTSPACWADSASSSSAPARAS